MSIKKNLHWYILLGLSFGFALGLFLNHFDITVLNPALKFGGDLFVRLLKMVVVPLVAASLYIGMTNVKSASELRVIGSRTGLYYIFTSLIAIIVGLFFVNLLQPGVGSNLVIGDGVQKELKQPNSVFDIFMNMIPVNPLGSLAEVPFDMMGILFFIIVFGFFSMKLTEDKRKPLVDFASAINDVMTHIVNAIILLAPIGVFCLVAQIVAVSGVEVFKPLTWYLITVFLALGFHFFAVLPFLFYTVTRQNPYTYMYQMMPALLTAFSSASSAATLSLTMQCAEKNKRVRKKVSSIVLPLGATMNMDGTALYEGVAVLFIAQVLGYELALSQQFLVLITALVASIGAAGIPHAGLVMMIIILEALNLPIEATGLIWAVDRVVDMARTATNVWSDSVGAVIIDQRIKVKDLF